jgi:hypothetical protein
MRITTVTDRYRSMKVALAAIAAVVLVLVVVRTIRARRPYSVDEALLSGWTLGAAPPGDTAVVEATPPARLLDDLFQQVSERMGEPLVAVRRASVPLVLEQEYTDSLQGVLSVEDILDVGRDVGLDSVRFEPVCLGRRHRVGDEQSAVVVAVFDAPEFDRFRHELTPLFPEHAGSGIYNPPAIRLTLPIAATSEDYTRWWPAAVGARTDCGAPLRATP